MCSTRGSTFHGSASWLALPLVALTLAGCGDGESLSWVGVQDCAVGIPPEGERGGELISVQLPLSEAVVTPLGSGFNIRNFSVGPIGGASPDSAGFSCAAPQVDVRFVALPGSPTSADPGVGRPLEVVPFECRGNDGRTYTLGGEGQGDLDALFFSQTFSAWLGAERATLICSTRFQRQAAADSVSDMAVPDTAVPDTAVPFGPAPGDSEAPRDSEAPGDSE